MFGSVGWTTMRPIVPVSVRPTCWKVVALSVDLYIPTPVYELRKMFDSPVPTQTMSGLDGATATAPIAVEAALSKTACHVCPRSSEAHKPPQQLPAYSRREVPRSATATSATRPLILVGPMNDQFMSRYGDDFVIDSCASHALRWAV